MKLDQVIAKLGDEKVGIQNLDECMTSCNWSIKTGTRITFGSDVRPDPIQDRLEKQGFVVWMDRADFARVLAEHAAAEAKALEACEWTRDMNVPYSAHFTACGGRVTADTLSGGICFCGKPIKMELCVVYTP